MPGRFRERPYDTCDVIWCSAVYSDAHYTRRRCRGFSRARAAFAVGMPPDEVGEILNSLSAGKHDPRFFVDRCKKATNVNFEALPRTQALIMFTVVSLAGYISEVLVVRGEGLSVRPHADVVVGSPGTAFFGVETHMNRTAHVPTVCALFVGESRLVPPISTCQAQPSAAARRRQEQQYCTYIQRDRVPAYMISTGNNFCLHEVQHSFGTRAL